MVLFVVGRINWYCFWSDVRLVLLVQLFVVVLFLVRYPFGTSCSVVRCGTVCGQMSVWYFLFSISLWYCFWSDVRLVLFCSVVRSSTVFSTFLVNCSWWYCLCSVRRFSFSQR